MNREKHLGRTKKMKNGLNATIIEYRTGQDIDIQFEDGVIVKNRSVYSFDKGGIKHPNINTRSLLTSIKGKTSVMNNGMKATVIEDRNSNDIDIRFEDGVIVRNRDRASFNNGCIAHPDFRNLHSGLVILNQTKIMKNHMQATVIKDCGFNKLTVEFADGTVVENQSRSEFKKGMVKHPRIDSKSLMKTIIFNEIYKYFPDAMLNYMPDFLHRVKTKNNQRYFVLGIYIPSIKMDIEYIYSSSGQRSETEVEKYQEIEKSDYIDSVIIISEKHAVSYDEFPKVVEYRMRHNSSYKFELVLPDVEVILTKILKQLGVSDAVHFEATSYDDIVYSLMKKYDLTVVKEEDGSVYIHDTSDDTTEMIDAERYGIIKEFI